MPVAYPTRWGRAAGERAHVDLTVRDALGLEIFARGQAAVVAGADHLHRVVRWVHSAEIFDIARFVRGGEMLLTAGTGIGTGESSQRAYVRSIAEAGVAVLVVELGGRAFAAMPQALVDEAERCELPTVALAQEISFVEAAAQVHGQLVDLQVRALLAEEQANAAFTDVLLRGEDYLAVVQELSRRVGHPCVLEDRAHQPLGYSGRTVRSDALLARWAEHSRGVHDPSGAHGCTREPVPVKGEVWGWLHLLHDGASLSGTDSYVLGRAATTVAISLLGEQVRGARRSQREGALINRLMLGDISGEGFVQRAMRLGHDVRNRVFLVATAGALDGGTPLGEPELAQCLRASGAVAIVADMWDSALAVIALPTAKDEAEVLTALGRLPGRVGVSRVVTASSLLLAVRQANSAFAATSAAPPGPALVRFDDLGVLRLLVPLADSPELAGFVEDELGRLLEHDATTGNALYPTLKAFLECDGRKSDAAQRLYVQRRTLYYRLERLEALLGLSLGSADVRHRLHLAVRGYEMLSHRSPSYRTGRPRPAEQ